ncbi:MAG: YlbF family regulator [Clostridia bacterium]|nr:YlbF family regulator [Clostridia bacterium]
MDMIELARQIGREIQQDETYIKMRLAEQTSEADEKLQELITDFNLKRMAINNEASKVDKDEEKLQNLNKEMRHLYAQVMQNENMVNYNKAKKEFDEKLQRVLAIIQNSAEGDDPETTDFIGGMGCSGRCGSCGGCG